MPFDPNLHQPNHFNLYNHHNSNENITNASMNQNFQYELNNHNCFVNTSNQINNFQYKDSGILKIKMIKTNI